MVSLDEAVIVRLKTHGHTFEIFVDPDMALSYKSGKGDNLKMEDILAVENVFKDASAGEKASEEVMKSVFGTDNTLEAAITIIKKGELHLTTEQRARMMEERISQVVSIIARNAINPQTQKPHPAARIEKAMEEAKVSVTIAKSAEEQVESVLKALKPIIPIRFDKTEIAVKIPPEYAGRLYNVLREFGDVKREEWVGKEQYCMIEIPSGLQDEFYSRLNNLTHGNVKMKVAK